MSLQREGALYEPGGVPLPDTLILDFQAFRVVRYNFFFYKPPGLWNFVMAVEHHNMIQNWVLMISNGFLDTDKN